MSGGCYDSLQYRAPEDLLAEGLRRLLNDLREHDAADVAERLVAWLTGPEDLGNEWPPDLFAVVETLDRWQSGDDATDAPYRVALRRFRQPRAPAAYEGPY